MNPEQKTCQNCKNQFTIEPDDFMFYEKMQVPPPTWCPDCRLQRRLAWRNERTLYRRPCDMCGTDRFSVYAPGTTFPVYCSDCFWSDKWDSLSYGIAIDFSKPFLAQYLELLGKVPRQGLMHHMTSDATYSNYVDEAKDIYLSYSAVRRSEHIFYSKNTDESEWIFDSFDVVSSHYCFQNVGCKDNYNCSFAYFSRGCLDSSFIYDCVNCKNCFLCTNLRNKEYCIKNEQYSKEEYLKIISAFDLGNSEKLEEIKTEFKDIYLNSLHKYARTVNSPDSTGDDIRDSKNARFAFSIYGIENGKYIFRSLNLKDVMDVTNCAFSELVYEFIGGGAHQSQKIRFCSYAARNINDAHYIDACTNSSYVFGCISLHSKKYCILNKQYTKEEYERMLPLLIEHMVKNPYIDSKGRIYKYGEFFPIEFSPFAYNETIVQEYFPLTPEEAKAKGYRWRIPDEKSYQISKKITDLPKDIKDVPDTIVNEIIGCVHEGKCNHQCTTAFKIVPDEFKRYRTIGVALPGLCPNCRHYERMSWRNPLKLWHRQCMCDKPNHSHTGKCSNEFETPYASDRKEIIYCEQCYQAEVV